MIRKFYDILLTDGVSKEPTGKEETYQNRVNDWMQVCFGEEISKDKVERNHRFLEESIELVQSIGATKSECHQLVDYVYSRQIGESVQEVGGVMVTLAALCLANGFDMNEAGELELKRIWTKVEKIRAKQAAKPKHSPLPESSPSPEPERIEKQAETEMNKWLPMQQFYQSSIARGFTEAKRESFKIGFIAGAKSEREEIAKLTALIKEAHSEGYEDAFHHIEYSKSWNEFQKENNL